MTGVAVAVWVGVGVGGTGVLVGMGNGVVVGGRVPSTAVDVGKGTAEAGVWVNVAGGRVNVAGMTAEAVGTTATAALVGRVGNSCWQPTTLNRTAIRTIADDLDIRFARKPLGRKSIPIRQTPLSIEI